MVVIDQATAADATHIAMLIGEIEAYYGGDGAHGDVETIRRLLFSEWPVAIVLLARDGDSVLGMASYSFLWPAAGTAASLYLKELYVRESARRRGVGSALMARLRELAVTAGCSRLEWTADRDNPAALAFYQTLTDPREGKVFYRLEK